MIPAFITFHQLLFMKLFAKVSKKIILRKQMCEFPYRLLEKIFLKAPSP